ncbi:MAG TPA: HD domain-containing protein [Solirubrobacteraceae bacterium]|jgi:3'-5' exoribonuclease|nr:HD domain-containing protein [Solirubrobacteraceae bacterium]
MFVKDLQEGIDVDAVLLVREAELRATHDGGQELRLALGDRTGSLRVLVCEDVARTSAIATVGAPLRVRGTVRRSGTDGLELKPASLAVAAAGSYLEADLHDGPPRSATLMEADLRELVGTVQSPDLRRLLDAVFGPRAATWQRYRTAPAAKRFHQAYRHGLLEHSLSVAQAVSAISATFGGIDRDVAVTGALLHDIGKLDAYAFAGAAIEMTDAGKLQGEIPLGYYRVRRLIDDIDGFDPGTAEAILHIILSHHGSLEHGSPVLPCTREATLVHFCDNLGGRLGSFDRLEKELPSGERWSRYDRAIGGGAYFAPAGEQVREAA